MDDGSTENGGAMKEQAKAGSSVESKGTKLSFAEEMMEVLVGLEMVIPLPTDEICVAVIGRDSEEYRRLSAVGLSESELAGRRIARGKLQEAGYAFVNRMYLPGKGEEMQKPLINVVIDGIDYGAKTLLTPEELEKVRELQMNPAITVEVAQEMRTDMVSFMLEAHGGRPAHFAILTNVFNHVLHSLGDEDRDRFNGFYQKWKDAVEIDESKLGKYDKSESKRYIATFFQTYCQDIFPWKDSANYPRARGYRLEALIHRRYSLERATSPFLDSGFVLPRDSYDCSVIYESAEKVQERRYNLLVWHLAGRGLSEVGASPDDAHDQQYMSMKDYYNLFFEGKTFAEREAIREDEAKRAEALATRGVDEIIGELVVRFKEVAERNGRRE